MKLLFVIPLFILVQLGSVLGFKLTILHTNDFHSRFEQTDQYGSVCFPKDLVSDGCYGGVARRATAIKQIREQEQNVVLLSAGDVFTGTLWYRVYKGNATWKFMNELGYDAMTLGNHDFDDGTANLARFLKHINCSVVVSNLNTSREPLWTSNKPLVLRYKILDIRGEKIGVVGYILQATPRYSKPGPGPNLQFLPEVEAVTSAVDDLKRQGINKIIAIGHSGIWKDEEVAKRVSGVDVVVGGHSHTFLYSGSPPKNDVPKGPYPVVVESSATPGQSVPVVQAYAFGIYLGRLDVEFDGQGRVTKWSGKPILLDRSVDQDKTVLQQVRKMKGKVEKVSGMKLGKTLVFLNADRPACRLKECNLGNLVTDAMVTHYANITADSNQWTGASIGILNSGSIMASIDVTPHDYITYGHLVNSLPYSNTFDIVELQGLDLKAAMEQSVSNYNTTNPSTSFLQVSGLNVLYDVTKPTGQRVISIRVRCAACREPTYKPLNHTGLYKVIAPSYIAGGGAGFTVIRDKKRLHQVGSLDSKVVASFITSNGPITIGVEGRIKFVKKEKATVGRGNSATFDGLLLVIAFATTKLIMMEN